MNYRFQNMLSAPAFPRPASVDTRGGSLPDGDRIEDAKEGMTDRQWLAGMALQGVISAHAGDGVNLPSNDKAVRLALEYTDALIKKLAE